MKGNVGKKIVTNEDETGKTAENKKREISRNVSREASLYLVNLPLDIINLIADDLPPSSIFLLGLTYSKRSDATSELYIELQLHHALKDWSGLAGHKYFNTADLYRLQHPSPLAKQMRWIDDDIFSVIRAAMSVMTMFKDTKSLKEVEFGALTKRQRKIRNSMKLAGGIFFKYPQPGGKKKYSWHELSEDERLDITDLIQLWAPRADLLRYELNLHRRLRWSQHMMASYAQWREAVGF